MCKSNLILILTQLLSQFWEDHLLAHRSTVDVLGIRGHSLEMRGSIVALGDENVVVDTALKWLVKWDRWTLKIKLARDVHRSFYCGEGSLP